MNSVVVPAAGGALLVDPGYFPAEIERIAAFCTAAGSEPGRVLLTHSDWDHIVGAGRWPGAELIASAEFGPRVEREGEKIARSLRQFDDRLYVRRDPPVVIPRPGTLVGSPSDLVWDGPRAHLLPAGGHTSDGLMLLLREQRVLFVGDHLSDLEIPFVGDSFATYRDSLLHVRNLVQGGVVEWLVPGHGAVCGRQEALERIEEDRDYLERLTGWVRETSRTVETVEGLLDRAEEVVFRKGWENAEVQAEHRANITLAARHLRDR